MQDKVVETPTQVEGGDVEAVKRLAQSYSQIRTELADEIRGDQSLRSAVALLSNLSAGKM